MAINMNIPSKWDSWLSLSFAPTITISLAKVGYDVASIGFTVGLKLGLAVGWMLGLILGIKVVGIKLG